MRRRSAPAVDRAQPSPGHLLQLILFWTSLTSVGSWLPLVRGAFDGASYRWMHGYWGLSFRGQGVDGDYWLPVLEVGLALPTLWLGWRGGARRLFRVLLLAHQLILLTSSFHAVAAYPESYRWVGATLGLRIPLLWIGPISTSTFTIATVVWLVRDVQSASSQARWTSWNTAWVAGLAAMLPVQFALLRLGEPMSQADRIGVILTMLQWFLVGIALRPRDAAPAPA